MSPEKIISLLPFSKPFLFVDSIESVDEASVKGSYTYKPDEWFYSGHFKNYPVTPGVILSETMAQIGVVCLGIYLLRDEAERLASYKIAMTSVQADYLVPVFPGETVTVISQKVYFRLGKLKCNVTMVNSTGNIVSKAVIAGIFKSEEEIIET